VARLGNRFPSACARRTATFRRRLWHTPHWWRLPFAVDFGPWATRRATDVEQNQADVRLEFECAPAASVIESACSAIVRLRTHPAGFVPTSTPHSFSALGRVRARDQPHRHKRRPTAGLSGASAINLWQRDGMVVSCRKTPGPRPANTSTHSRPARNFFFGKSTPTAHKRSTRLFPCFKTCAKKIPVVTYPFRRIAQ